MKNTKHLLQNFKDTLDKTHNYLRIANQYLRYLIANDIELSEESKSSYLRIKPAYKTALNKFFKSIDTELPFKVFEVVEEKQYLDIDNRVFYGLSKTSKETYYNIINNYKSIYKDNLDLKEFKSYIDSLYKKDINVPNHNNNSHNRLKTTPIKHCRNTVLSD